MASPARVYTTNEVMQRLFTSVRSGSPDEVAPWIARAKERGTLDTIVRVCACCVRTMAAAAHHCGDGCVLTFCLLSLSPSPPFVFGQPSDYRYTPMHVAAGEGHEVMISLLLDAGASANVGTADDVRSCVAVQLQQTAVSQQTSVVPHIVAAAQQQATSSSCLPWAQTRSFSPALG